MTRLALALAAIALLASLALAEPAVRVNYHAGVPQIELDGSYPNATYTVLRADPASGVFTPITAANVLCLGSCFGVDERAVPGATYAYRFDLVLPDGRFQSFGPYAVTISPLLARRVAVAVTPNPARGPRQVQVFLAGGSADPAVAAEVALFDLQGRRLRTLHRGVLARGFTSIGFDGRGANGEALRAGVFFVRLESALGSATARVVHTD
jgi:hypothetical protein